MPGSNSRRWQWSEDLLLPALGACARATWQWPLAQLALNNTLVAPGAHLPAWLLAALLLLPGLANKALAERRWGRYAVAVCGAVAVALATLAVTASTPAGLLAQFDALGQGLGALARLPAVAPALAIVFVLWIEGSAANWLRYADAWRSAIAGAAALIALTALFAAWGRESDPQLVLAMAAFLVANLLALALLSVRGTLALEQLRHSRRLGVSRYWLSAMVALIVLLLLAGWAIASISDPGMVRSLFGALRSAAGWLGRTVAAALAWVLYGVFWLLDPFIRWLQGLAGVRPQLGAAEALGEQVRQLAEESGELATTPLWWQRLTSLLGYALAAGFALWLLLRAVRRPRAVAAAADEERESIFSAALLGAQLRTLFTGQRRRAASPFVAPGTDDPAAEVRRAYQTVLQALQQRGWGRQPGQTPHALARDIAARLPAAAPALARLTDAYALARYGNGVDPEGADAACEASSVLLALLPIPAVSSRLARPAPQIEPGSPADPARPIDAGRGRPER